MLSAFREIAQGAGDMVHKIKGFHQADAMLQGLIDGRIDPDGISMRTLLKANTSELVASSYSDWLTARRVGEVALEVKNKLGEGADQMTRAAHMRLSRKLRAELASAA